MPQSCTKCGASAVAADPVRKAESLSWHVMDDGSHVCPRCWRQNRDSDPTVQAARRLTSEGAE